MQLALECPTKMLSQVQAFADLDFMLAHLVLQDEAYTNFYKSSNKRKFLDNSVNELGTPETIQNILQAYEKIKGTDNEILIVSPDYLGDYKKTVQTYLEFIQAFKEIPVGTVAVLQGRTYEEVFTCLRLYIQIHGGKAPFLAIPYDICSEKTDPPSLMAMRRALIVSNLPPQINVHLLGFTDIEEFWWYRGKPNIVSIDTGVPVLLGLQSKDILDPLEEKTKPTLNMMEELQLTKDNYMVICRNIALLRTYI